MKRFISVFLCLILCFSIVIPVSAVSLDSDFSNDYIDLTPYLDPLYKDISSLSAGESFFYSFDIGQMQYIKALDFIVQTDDTNFKFATSTTSGSNIIHIKDDLYRVYVSASVSFRDDLYLKFTKSNGTYVNILKFTGCVADYTVSDIDLTVYLNSISYEYRIYNSDGSYTTSTANTGSASKVIPGGTGSYDLPLIKSHEGAILGNEPPVNEARAFITAYSSFEWKAFDRVDLFIYNSFESLNDYVFYVDGIDVLSDIQSVVINNQETTIVSLNFAGLDRNNTSDLCTCRFRGYDTLYSSHTPQLFYFEVVGFTDIVSNNFWPSWLQKIIDKLDAMITGRGEDQSAADSFQDTVDEQASQFEDMSNTMNQVERPDIESIDLSTSNMVDTDSVILATNGIGTILENPIILKVILMALTLALAGFVLYGKR